MDCQPMITHRALAGALITKKLRCFPVVIHHEVLPAIVVIIADGQSPAHAWREKCAWLRGADINKFTVADVAIQAFLFGVSDVGVIERNVVEDMSVDDQEVSPAVVIKIKKSRAKTAVAVVR